MATLRVFDPTPPSSGQQSHTKTTLKDLRGASIGFIDNSKPNFNYLVDDLAELLVSKHGIARVVRYRKRVAGMATPATTMQELIDQCSLIITGSGD